MTQSRPRLPVLLVALALLSSGCFLRLSVANIDPYGDGQLRFGAGLANCSEFDDEVQCSYTVFDDEGFLVDITSTAELLSDYGFFGLLIDPVVLQVPADLVVIQAVYDRDGRIGQLLVEETPAFDAAPGETVTAEPGHKFLILDLPAGDIEDIGPGDARDGPTFGFTLSFNLPEPRPLQVKPMFTAHVMEEGRDYYPPLLPCVTDFAQVPPLDIPVDFTGQDITDAVVDLARANAPLACQDRVYSFATGPVTRLAGPDRIATSIATSQASHGSLSAAAVVLARADAFPDALAGAPFARAQGGPILLTASDALDPRVAEEITRLLAPGSTVFLLGGTAALSDGVAQAVTDLGYGVERLAGANRFATAAAIAGHVAQPRGPLFIADGGTFQAALLAGNAAARDFTAVLLTDGAAMPAETQAFIDAHPELERVAVGTPAVTADPAADGVPGEDPARLSVDLAMRVWGTDVATVAVASATAFPDGLTGGPHSADRQAPLLLTDPQSLSQPLRDHLTANPTVDRVFVYGGEAAVSADVADELRGLVSSPDD